MRLKSLAVFLIVLAGTILSASAPETKTEQEKELQKLTAFLEEGKIRCGVFFLDSVYFLLNIEGNYAEAKDVAVKGLEALPENHPGAEPAVYWKNYVYAIRELKQEAEYDDMLERMAKKFPKNPYFITEAAGTGVSSSGGYMINGKFRRGDNRGYAGRWISCQRRDHVRRLQLMADILPEIETSSNQDLKWNFYCCLGNTLKRDGIQSWHLQSLTDLTAPLPDYGDETVSWSRPPVHPDGTPVFYSDPGKWENAKNDGERMRWAYARAIELAPDVSAGATHELAHWLKGQFDFSSVDDQIRGEYLSRDAYLDYLYNLKDNETVAELADGIRKITLPDDQNYIRMMKKNGMDYELARIYAARGQLELAAEYFRKSGNNERAEKITGEYGIMAPFQVHAAGTPPRMEYTYRNAKSAKILIRKADTGKAVGKMLDTLKTGKGGFHDAYQMAEKIHDNSPDWNGCIGETVAEYSIELAPKPHHRDNTRFIDLPLNEPGAYLVRVTPGTAKDHWAEALVWITPKVLTAQNVCKRFFILSNPDGTPCGGNKVRLEKYFTQYAQNPAQVALLGGRTKIHHETKEYTTAQDGTLSIPQEDFNFNIEGPGYTSYSYLLLVQDEKSLTWIPGANYGYYNSDEYTRERNFVITDRPIYKPGDTVKFTVYCRTATYGTPPPLTEDKEISLTIFTPRHKKERELTVEQIPGTGAFTGEFTLPADAALGQWQMSGHYLHSSFRVEEYKKPEYELKVTTPGKPVKLGDKFPVTVQGKYYFGAPMSGAKVTYKIYREEAKRVYPFFGRFDWLYGPGYLICSTAQRANDERHTMYGRELAADASCVLDQNGKLEIQVNTAEALTKFGAHDTRYTVEAQISDDSNRVVNGTGSVLAAARPFYVWLNLDRGYAVTGQSFGVHAKALTGDGKEVAGKGIMKIYRRTLNKDGMPERTGEAVRTVSFIPGAYNAPSFVMNQPGVYELEAVVTTDDGITESGSRTFYVQGESLSGELFSDEEFEITLDKGEYQPGDTARILVTAKKPGRTVYFYRRTERGIDYDCITLSGTSRVFEMKLEKADQPNTFVHLYSVADGKYYSLTKEIPVPPESKMLNVSIDAPAEKVKPQTTVPLKIKVTGLDGKPVKGAVTVAVYDKALEALASANVPALNQFFWNWRKYAPLHGSSGNLDRTTGLTTLPGQQMEPITSLMGIFYYRNLEFKSYGGSPGSISKAIFACDTISEAVPAPPMAAYKNEKALPDKEISAEAPAVSVRSDFKDTAYWLGIKDVAEDGTLTVDVPLPDDLTTWKVKVWSLTPDTRAGEGSAEIVVSKNLIARLELPRFLIQGDTVQAVANIHNYTGKAQTVKLSLHIDGTAVSAENQNSTITVPPQNHTAQNFILAAKNTGEAKITLSAVTEDGKESDALILKLPVLVKGIGKQVNACGRLDKEKRTATVTLNVPEQRKPESTFLTLNLSPGAAKTMVELLPYLADDDSRDVFGTVSRFVPALSAEAALKKLGVSFDDLKLAPGSRDKLYSEYMQLYVLGRSDFSETKAAFDPAVFRRVIAGSRAMILSMVNSDGGWGWFSGHRERSYPDTTAFVLDALLTAKKNGADIPNNILKGGTDWLYAYAEERIEKIKIYDYVSSTDALAAAVLKRAGKPNTEFADMLYERRITSHLSPYGLAMLAFAYNTGSDERIMLKRNLTQYLKQDEENGTAYLEIPDNMRFFWWGNENVTQAAYLRLLTADDPADPVAAKLANYLVTNIRNSPWRNSTRTLGAAVQALAEYIMASGENKIDLTATVKLDGKILKTFRINSRNMWQNEFCAAAGPDQLSSGRHKLKIEMEGQGVLYFNSMLNYFTLEDRIKPAGLEMKLRRNYYKLVREKDAAELAAGTKGSLQTVNVEKYSRVPLKEGDLLLPGDVVEVELVSTAKNDYDYVVFADSMPAGFEYVRPVSGYVWNWHAPVYCEYRERGARFYLRHMARGESRVCYQIRAQLPGRFTGLPASGKGVYAPELKCSSGQMIFRIGDREMLTLPPETFQSLRDLRQ